MAYFELWVPYWHSKMGTPPIDARMRGSRSSSMKSPGFIASSCSTVASALASSATSTTSAAWISRVSTRTQRRSTSMESPCVEEYSTSRMGSSVA
ncbi:hypothetical protein D3C72_2028290 [compost metagenome]